MRALTHRGSPPTRRARAAATAFGLLGGLAAGAGAGAAVAAAADAAPPTVIEVRIEGTAALAEGELRADWRSLIGRPAEPAELARLADLTLGRYAARGWLEAACRLSLLPAGDDDGGGCVLTVRYEEGEAALLGDVRIEGNVAATEQTVRRLLGGERGGAFSPGRLVAATTELLEYYEQQGYPFAQLSVRDFEDGDGVGFRLVIDEGDGASVVGLSVTGNESTRESYLAREMLLRTGRPWNRRALERGRARLLRTGLFRSVGAPYPLLDAAAGGLRVGLLVEEAPANRIEGVFGWNQGEGAEDGFFSGYLDLLLKNLGGVGRRVAVRWERRARDARELRFGLREPWVPLLPLGVGVDLSRTFRDSTYARTEIAAEIELPVNAALTLSARVGSESWSPGDREPQVVPRSRRVAGGGGVRFEATDYPPNPSRGVNLELSADFASKRIDEIAAVDSTAAETRTLSQRLGAARVELYVPIGGPHLIALRAQGEMISSDERPIPEYELFFLGGARSLRGYDEDRFLGERVGVASIEYRLRLASRSRVFLFVDQGYYFLERLLGESADVIEKVDGTPFGWGGGIQTESRLGILGMGVGIPEGEGLSNARVHVSIEQEF